MSGLSRTPGKRVQGNTLTGVRIPPSPPRINNTLFYICFYRLVPPRAALRA
jgi:hypothetical protein